MRRRSYLWGVLRYWPECLAAILGFIALAEITELTAAWISYTFQCGATEWLFKTEWLSNSVGPLALKAFYELPSIGINLAAGVAFGLISRERGLRLAVIFGAVERLSLAALAPKLWLSNAAFELLAFLMVVAGAVLARRIRGPRIKPGFCRQCGYDLTGNITGRCPECGTEFLMQQDSTA